MTFDAEAFRALALEPRCCDTHDCREKRTADALLCAVDEVERLRALMPPAELEAEMADYLDELCLELGVRYVGIKDKHACFRVIDYTLVNASDFGRICDDLISLLGLSEIPEIQALYKTTKGVVIE